MLGRRCEAGVGRLEGNRLGKGSERMGHADKKAEGERERVEKDKGSGKADCETDQDPADMR